MLLEDFLLFAVIGLAVALVVRPIYRFLRAGRPRDPLAEAKERLRVAQLEAEAARLNQETAKIYEHLYDDAMADKPAEGAGPRVASDDSAAQALEEPADRTEKGRRDGQG